MTVIERFRNGQKCSNQRRMSAALSVLAALGALAFLYPYIVYPLSLRMMKAQPVPRGDAPRPSASLLFAAYNEERALPAKLENIAAIKALHPDIEVIAWSDMSSDNSLSLLQSRPDLLRVIAAEARRGKAAGMRRMAEAARGEICIFTDANVLLDPASVGPLLDYFRAPEIGGVAGTLHYVNDADSATASAGGLYWRLEEAIKALESRCGSIMGADGSIFATRRALYPDFPAHLLDDMVVSMSVVLQGSRLISAPDVIAWERNVTLAGEEFRRKRRIACRAYNTHRFLAPQIRRRFSPIDRYKYAAHKLLRWFGAPLLALAAGAGSAALWLGGHGTALALLWAMAAAVIVAGLSGVRGCATLVSMGRAILATFIGVTDAWRGRTYQTWTPAKSRD